MTDIELINAKREAKAEYARQYRRTENGKARTKEAIERYWTRKALELLEQRAADSTQEEVPSDGK